MEQCEWGIIFWSGICRIARGTFLVDFSCFVYFGGTLPESCITRMTTVRDDLRYEERLKHMIEVLSRVQKEVEAFIRRMIDVIA